MYDRLIYIYIYIYYKNNTQFAEKKSWDDYPKSDGTILRNNIVVFLLG